MINLTHTSNVYMIRRTDQFDPWFFLYDCLETPPEMKLDYVVWTPNKIKAREFYSEESVETYFYEKLRNRPCEIIMIK